MAGDTHELRMICFLLLVCVHSFISPIQGSNTLDDLQKRAEYHLEELTSVIKEMETTHRRYKRDTSKTATIPIKMSKALREICLNFHQDNDDITTTTETPTSDAPTTTFAPEVARKKWRTMMEENITYYDKKDNPMNWPKPGLYVDAVDFKRIEGNAYVVVNISHSSQAFVVRLWSIDSLNKVVGVPGIYLEPVTSVVTIPIDTPECGDHIIFYSFSLVGDKRHRAVIAINHCNVLKLTKKGDELFMKSKSGGTMSVQQRFPRAYFRVKSMLADNPDEIVITPGVNPVFYIDIDFNEQTHFHILYTFWDWENSTFLENRLELGKDSDDLVKADMINTTNGTRYRIVIDIGSKRLSGKVTLHHGLDLFNTLVPRILDMVMIKKDILFRLPSKISVLPSDNVWINTANEQTCGNAEHYESTTSCVISCSAEGTNIKSIFIVKDPPYIPPVKYTSYVINGYDAESQMDMGRPSSKIDGTYRCVVVTDNGAITSEEIKVTSFDHTVVHSTFVEDLGNGSSLITCAASGFQPLKMDVRLIDKRYDYHTIKQADRDHSSLETVENRTILKVLVNTTMLMFPITKVYCSASGERGEDGKSVGISWYIHDYNSTAPTVLRDLFTMTVFANGTSQISCTASGGEPLRVIIRTQPPYFHGQNLPHHYHHGASLLQTRKRGVNRHASIVQTHTDVGRTTELHLTEEFVSMMDLQDVQCEAHNYQGKDVVQIHGDKIFVQEFRQNETDIA